MMSKMPSPDILPKNLLIFIDSALKIYTLDGKRLLITRMIISLSKNKNKLKSSSFKLNVKKRYCFPVYLIYNVNNITLSYQVNEHTILLLISRSNTNNERVNTLPYNIIWDLWYTSLWIKYKKCKWNLYYKYWTKCNTIPYPFLILKFLCKRK